MQLYGNSVKLIWGLGSSREVSVKSSQSTSEQNKLKILRKKMLRHYHSVVGVKVNK